MQTFKLTRKYEKYPEYKDSGIEWLGEISKEWSIAPLRSLSTENQLKNSDGGCQNLLSLSYGKVIEKDINSNEGLLPESFNTYQIINKGNIVFRLTDLQNDKKSLRVGYVDLDKPGIITSAYLVLNIQNNLDPKYAYYLLHAYDLQKVYYGMGGGVRQTLDFHDFKYLPIVVPDLDTQLKIKNYLDEKIFFIDCLIEKKNELIQLLEEKRIAYLANKIKDQVDWKKEKIKHLVNSIESGIWGENSTGDSNDIKCLRVADFDYTNLSFTNVETVRNNQKLSQRKILQSGDILIEKSGGGEKTPVGRAILFDSSERMVCANFIDVIRIKKEKIVPSFLVFYLAVLYSRRVNTKYIKQNTGIQNIDIKSYFGEYISFPDLLTQNKIIADLKRKMGIFNNTISETRNSIEFLQEFKSSLISNVVTGKIKV